VETLTHYPDGMTEARAGKSKPGKFSLDPARILLAVLYNFPLMPGQTRVNVNVVMQGIHHANL